MYAYFNIIHVLFLMLPIVLLVTFYNLFKDKSHKVQTVFLLCCVAVSATISLYDTFCLVPTEGWKGALQDLPIYPCDLNNIILPFVILKKNKKSFINTYVLYVSLSGPLFSLLAPIESNYTHYFYDYEIWGTCVAHTMYIVVSVLYLKFNHIKPSSNGFWKTLFMLLSMLSVVHIINLVLIYTGIDSSANYFFTGHPYDTGIVYRFAVLVGYNIPWIRCYFLMLISYTGIGLFFYYLHKGIETETFTRFWSGTKATLKKLLTPKEKKLEAERESNSESGFES